MTTDQTQQAAPQEPPRATDDPTDQEFAAMLTDTVPGSHANEEPTPLGNAIYNLVLRALAHERNRCATLCHEVRDQAKRTGGMATAAARAQAADGETAKAREAAAVANNCAMLAQAVDGIARTIMLPPGACKVCRGTKRMPSRSITTTTGAPVMVECDACKTARPAAAPPPAEASTG